MKHFASMPIVCALLALLWPDPAAAQAVPGFDQRWSDKVLQLDEDHYQFVGAVELWRGDTRFFAEKVDYWKSTHRLIATGNVTVIEGDSSISAGSIDFNTETETGTFYNAWGMASLGNRVDRSMFGTLEPDMYFYGETIEKIGDRKYRVTRGGFTTCVQPVPRWELTSGSVVLNLDHYAVLTNSVLRVKGVPVLYLPFLYYPVKTKEDQRSTGFLMPTYGSSSAHGFSLSNAFFWAINRSQDLTLTHDYYSKTGQGFGQDYRYVRGPGAWGNVRFHLLDEHEFTSTDSTGASFVSPAKRSYSLDAQAAETLGKYVRASANVHYFTNLVTQQTYNMNIFDASRSTRTANASIAAAWRGIRVVGSVDRSEYFQGATDSNRTGALPRISFTRGEQPIGNLPIYVTFGGEYVTLERGSTTTTTGTDGTTSPVRNDLTVSRIDFSPTVRVPFTRWPFLTVNSSINWRGTYWTNSWDPADHNVFLDRAVSRRLFEFSSTITGPVLTRIFNMSPANTYADKLKHTIEPSLTVDYTTGVPEFDRIINWESVDSIVGGTTRLTYGITNRLYAKRKRDGKVQGSREILNVGISQTYYTNETASQFDPSYATSFTRLAQKPNNFSPIAITARGVPTDTLNATFRAELDSRSKALRTVSTNATYALGSWLYTGAGWSLTRSLDVNGLVNPTGLQQFLNSTTNIRLAQNKYGGNYSFNYDIAQHAFVQQRITAYYNAQCCGFAVEYQTFDFGTLPGVPVPQDRRFNFSVTLAGVGSFSNFFGALSGAPR